MYYHVVLKKFTIPKKNSSHFCLLVLTIKRVLKLFSAKKFKIYKPNLYLIIGAIDKRIAIFLTSIIFNRAGLAFRKIGNFPDGPPQNIVKKTQMNY